MIQVWSLSTQYMFHSVRKFSTLAQSPLKISSSLPRSLLESQLSGGFPPPLGFAGFPPPPAPGSPAGLGGSGGPPL
jgi:hypothetical protein